MRKGVFIICLSLPRWVRRNLQRPGWQAVQDTFEWVPTRMREFIIRLSLPRWIRPNLQRAGWEAVQDPREW
jgi:hypothetical protein